MQSAEYEPEEPANQFEKQPQWKENNGKQPYTSAAGASFIAVKDAPSEQKVESENHKYPLPEFHGSLLFTLTNKFKNHFLFFDYRVTVI